MDEFQQRRSPLSQFLGLLITKSLHLILINLLFVLTSLPLITLPLTMAALTKTTQGIVNGKDQALVQVYFKTMKQDLARNLLLGYSSMFLLFVNLYGCYFYFLNATTFLYLFFTYLLIVLFVLLYSVIINSYQMFVAVDLPITAILKNAIILVFQKPRQVLFASIGSLLILIVSLYFFPYSTPILLVLSFSLASYIATFSLYPFIQTMIVKQERL